MKSDVLAPTEEHALSHEVLSVALLLLWLRQTRLLHATCSETVFFFSQGGVSQGLGMVPTLTQK